MGEEADKKDQQEKKKKKKSKSKKKKSKTKSKDDKNEANKKETPEGVHQVATASDHVTSSDQVVEGKDKEDDDELSRQRQERRERAWLLEDEKRESERQKAGQDEANESNMSGECIWNHFRCQFQE